MRSAVVLVRATVAEAFRDAKRDGGWSSFPGLPADGLEGLEGIALVLSPNARKEVTMPLDGKPSGTEKRVWMSYILNGRGKVRRQVKRQGAVVDVDKRIGKEVSTLCVCRDGRRPLLG